MTGRLTSLLYAVRTNFWFIPTGLAVLAIAASLMVVELDVAIQRQTWVPLHMSIESARLVLSTIAGSMITIASLVFSMTLVALTSVSQQLGPRILQRFMDDRPTQFALGIFIATFLFALILLMRVGDDARGGVVPGLGVTLSAGLAIVAIGTMIHFFDHVAKRLQADALIGELARDLQAAAQEYVGRTHSDARSLAPDAAARIEKRFDQADCTMAVKQLLSGYLRRVDGARLCRLGAQEDLIMRVEVRPGQFVLADQAVLTVAYHEGARLPDDIENQLGCLMRVAEKRMPEATIEFEIDALVEVALRALSPGVNDPFTAIACVDHLADGMRLLATGKDHYLADRDTDDVVRVIHKLTPFREHLDRAFGPVIAAASGNEMVLRHMARAMEQLKALGGRKSVMDALEDLCDRLGVHGRA